MSSVNTPTSVSTLVVPIKLSSRLIEQPTASKGPLHQFSKLPYTTSGGDNNPDTAYLAASLMRAPFNNQACLLESGMYLHWQLPEAIMVAKTTMQEADSTTFYPVPNRWLVQRTLTDGSVTSFVVESDYLSATSSASSVTFPIPPGFTLNDAAGKPYGWLGRVQELSSYLASTTDSGQYLSPPLTAVGYGESTFAQYFPGCTGVFGMFDDGVCKLDTGQSVTYQVLGWYSESEDDFLTQIASTNGITTFDQLSEQVGWNIGDVDSTTIPQCSLYYGELSITGADIGSSSDPKPTACVGLSATDALIADVTEDQTTVAQELQATAAEREQFNFAQLWPQIQLEKQFEVTYGGSQWQVTSHTEELDLAPIPDDLQQALTTLNQSELQLCAVTNQIEAMQQQLYGDWCKYMMCAYPPDGEAQQYPDIDQVRQYITETWFGPLNALLTVQLPTAQQAQNAAQSAAEQAITAANAKLTISDVSSMGYQLKQVAHSRFYQPRDPVIQLLFDTASVTASNSSTLSCMLLQSCSPPVGDSTQSWTGSDVLAAIATAATANTDFSQQLAELSVAEKPIPTLLEWQVEILPLGESNLKAESRSYSTDFLQNNFNLTQNSAFAEYTGSNKFAGQAVQYQGCVPLNMTTELIHTLKVNCGLSSDSETPLPSYGQAMSGFNQALLMLEQMPQLKIADPLAFNEYLVFTQQVAGLLSGVGTSSGYAPLPMNNFSPLRNGVMRIVALSWVDQFGVAYDITLDSLKYSPSLAKPAELKSDASVQQFPMWLSPGWAQSARMNFRFLTQSAALPTGGTKLASESQLTATDTGLNQNAVCGWLIADNLNQQLHLYSQGGQALGSIGTSRTFNALENSTKTLPAALTAIADFCSGLSGSSEFVDFLNALDTAQQTISPSTTLAASSLAVLTSRPIAVVRAGFEFQLQHIAAEHQGWDYLRMSMQPQESPDQPTQVNQNGFAEVKSPVRLGEYGDLNDGLLGYWQIQESTTSSENTANINLSENYFAIQGEAYLAQSNASGSSIKTGCNTFWQSPCDAATQFLLLMDAQAPVHATCGLLPTKSIQLPVNQFKSSLQQVTPFFEIGPILTPKNQTQLNLPTESKLQWCWQCAGETGTSSIAGNSTESRYYNGLELLSGTLSLKPLSNQSQQTASEAQ